MNKIAERMTLRLPDLLNQTTNGMSNIYAVINSYSRQAEDNHCRSKMNAKKNSI